MVIYMCFNFAKECFYTVKTGLRCRKVKLLDLGQSFELMT